MNAVRGKSRYLCELSGNTEYCDKAYCNDCDYLVKNEDIRVSRDGPLRENIDLNPEKILCKYYKADMIGKKSNYSVYSYASYIARMMAEKFKMLPEDKLPERTVLVCDEAHDYDDVVTKQLSVEIDGVINAKYAGKALPIFSGQDNDEQKIEKTRNFIEEILEKFKDALQKEKNCAKHSNILSSTKHLVMHQELKCGIHNFAYDKKCESCQRMKKFLGGEWIQCQKHLDLVDNCPQKHANILKDVKELELYTRNLEFLLPGLTEFPYNYVITKKQANKFTVAPLRTAWFTKQILEKFNLCIFMSATINRTIISKETGIPEKVFEFIDQPSEIPEKQRQIQFLNTYWYRHLEDWNIMTNKIKEIFDKHPNERGLIMCTSYEQKGNILEIFEKSFPYDYKRLTDDAQGREIKDTILENTQKENGVIISAKAGTGIDLKDELSRFQIIIKAPYLREVSDENNIRAKKIQEVDPSRYWIKSMLRLIQFAGRSVRGIDDYAETYVLDESAQKMIKNNRKYVPDWFLKACRGLDG
jgi:Rad3-related DNA helicase